MSILIKGVEKPKGCCRCRFLSKTKISSDCKFLTIDYYCDVLAKWKGKTDCPLIELPPHGRLIDIDDIDSIVVNIRITNKTGIGVSLAAPTIIESEGEDG